MSKLKLRPGTILPSDEEDAKIRKAAKSDPDTMLLEDENIKLFPYNQLKTLRRKGRPVTDCPKVSVNIRYSPEVVDAFRATGSGWQTRMNAALKDWLKQHKPEDVKI
ncbi:BrnA antitoxin family protein [Salmonella enterica subsp. enterica serovar Newport]|nr:BrnA antitoxin family protein [Salmonella enterica]EBE4778014.1 BrnA antitoxin family protein [Salmonella enterica]EII7448344.1 BrnA antitoxin family protein [Salmonella enterica subsp. enterica serovar Newport]MDJ7441155.1 BrnA antitoxin family protein [Salmonella enterica]